MSAPAEGAAPGSTADAMPVLRRRVVRALRTGVSLSAYALLVAIVGYAIFHTMGIDTAPVPATGGNVAAAFTSPSAGGLVLLGLLVLAITPLTRVVISLGYFASVGDRAFTGVTLFVFLVLLLSVAVGTLL
jgi:uncharacterized membrane protein